VVPGIGSKRRQALRAPAPAGGAASRCRPWLVASAD